MRTTYKRQSQNQSSSTGQLNEGSASGVQQQGRVVQPGTPQGSNWQVQGGMQGNIQGGMHGNPQGVQGQGRMPQQGGVPMNSQGNQQMGNPQMQEGMSQNMQGNLQGQGNVQGQPIQGNPQMGNMQQNMQGMPMQGNQPMGNPQQMQQSRPVDPNRQRMIERYKKLYVDLMEANEISNSMDNAKFSSNEEEQPKKKSPLKWIILVIIIAVIATAVYQKKSKKEEESTTEATTEVKDVFATVQAEIDRLYTTGEKVDTLTDTSQDSLTPIYAELAELEAQGNDVTEVKSEVNNISKYLEDKATIYSYMAIEVDLKTIIQEQLDAIKTSVAEYTVSGLALTMTNNVTQLETEIKTYNDLLNELQSIEDFENYDEAKYEAAISSIGHTPNKLELTEIHAKNIVKMKKAQGKKEAEDKAKEEADAAKDKALEELNKSKEEADKKAQQLSEELQKMIEDAKKTEATTQAPTSTPDAGTATP